MSTAPPQCCRFSRPTETVKETQTETEKETEVV
jgi:hypothetical protein